MSWLFGPSTATRMVEPQQALPGRADYAFEVPERHAVLGTRLRGPWPAGTATIGLAMGCFWGAERALWQLPGVITTAAGYQGGSTPFPTYEEVCTGLTGHAETVLVAYDPAVLPHGELLRVFWESHDPTQGYRQGNDRGTQYRSAVYTSVPDQAEAAAVMRAAYQDRLTAAGHGPVTTELRSVQEAGPFFYAEEYHQQYLHKIPDGYCGLAGTGVACPTGLGGLEAADPGR